MTPPNPKYPYYHGLGYTSSLLGAKQIYHVWSDKPYTPPTVRFVK